MDDKLNPELRNAVRYLYGAGIIEKDKDIVEKTKYAKGTVSAYINGTGKASADFITKFEQVFEISLEDFKEGQVPTNAVEVNYRDKYIKLLEKREQESSSNYGKILHYSQLNQARMVTIFQHLAKHRAKMEQLDFQNVQAEMNKDLDENFQDILKRGR